MTTNQDNNEVYRFFRDSIFSDLTANLKPVISSLTMIAEDYKNKGNDYYKAADYDKAVEFYSKAIGTQLKYNKIF